MLPFINPMMLGGGKIRPQDVFATSLYTGNGGTQTITNGLDLAGKGGLTWFKKRSSAQDHFLLDSARGLIFGFSPYLVSNSTAAEVSPNAGFVFPRSAGTLEIGDAAKDLLSAPGASYVNWSFRRAKKFFDIVTYTGNGQPGRQIPHGLGDVPGMIVVKAQTTASNWTVRHRSATGNLYLDLTKGQEASFNHITATDAGSFTVSSADNVNTNGVQYVAYLFAHNPDLIDCGSYTGNGSTNGPNVTCGKGWPPQFVLIKNASGGGNWVLLDQRRNLGFGGNDPYLLANTSAAETTGVNMIELVGLAAGTGFQPVNTSPDINSSGQTYVFMAIRSPT